MNLFRLEIMKDLYIGRHITNNMIEYTKVGATIPCAATGEKYALSGAVRMEV